LKDPRFEVRRAHHFEYSKVYDLIDQAFARKRSREEFKWLYEKNPTGKAQCWMVLVKETGELVSSETIFPWPIRYGDDDLEGVLMGDSATSPHWQGQGTTKARRRARLSHPWTARTVGFAGPNEHSRTAAARGRRRANKPNRIMGPIPGGVMLFKSRPSLERLGLPAGLATPAGALCDLALTSYQMLTPARSTKEVQVEVVQQFDSNFNEITERSMRFDKLWSPHDSEFLNWRYFDHPTYTYHGIAVVENDRPAGYCVIRLDENRAALMEFACPQESPELCRRLLTGAVEMARSADCDSLNFFAPPSWRHWPLFRRSAFLPYRTENYLSAGGERYEPEIFDLENWQLLPGDRDFQ